MNRITIDSATAEKLDCLAQEMEFYDEDGNLLGRFEPDENSPIRQWLKKLETNLPDRAEIERRIVEGKTFTTEEVIARLRGRNS
jgi:hypothetical protein